MEKKYFLNGFIFISLPLEAPCCCAPGGAAYGERAPRIERALNFFRLSSRFKADFNK